MTWWQPSPPYARGLCSLLSLYSSKGKVLKGINASKSPSVQSTNACICLISLPLLGTFEMPSIEGCPDSDLFTSDGSRRSLSCSWGAQGQVCWPIFPSSPGSGILRALQHMGSLVWAGCLLASFSVLPRPSPTAPEPLADGEGWPGWVCCTHSRLEHEVAANKWVCPDRLDLAWCRAKLSQPTGLPATGGFLPEMEFAVLLLAVIR